MLLNNIIFTARRRMTVVATSQTREVNKLVEMKGQLGKSKSSSKKLIIKTARGTRDFDPKEMVLRKKTIEKIVSVFEKHGAVTMQTPIFEFKEVLTGKYGEDAKLIYDLKEQDEESLALRYDLTVPLARYLATHKITNITRYQIDKVFRRDTTVMTKGRCREFYQCDFDIAGHYDPMVPDAKCIHIVDEILNKLDLSPFKIKVNHRCLLDGIFAACGVPAEKFRSICSSVDKLGKITWEEVEKEMTEEKGLDAQIAVKIGKYVMKKGGKELVDELRKDADLMKQPSAVQGLNAIELLLKYCYDFEVSKNLVFDLSLARGLDYYTGVIYEAVLTGEDVNVGSVAGGGRYDNLVGMFDPENKPVPVVGVSVGFERISSVQQSLIDKTGVNLRTSKIQVFVASAQKKMHEERMKILTELWDADFMAEHSKKKNPKLLDQLQHCESNDIPLVVIIGERELNNNEVTLRDVKSRKETSVPRDQLINELKKQLTNRGFFVEQHYTTALTEEQFSKLFEIKTQSCKDLSCSSKLLKTPKGTRDYVSKEMPLRREIIEKIAYIYEKHGAKEIDTPTFELKELLTEPNGADFNLIYDLKDQGGELLALRYDLTVPFARFLAMNKITNYIRYQVGQVYRRDNPDMTKGKYREFYQCDFDIAGQYDPMLPDAECLRIIYEILKLLDVGPFKIKVNHRCLVNGIFAASGVPAKKFHSICSTLDKLDKSSWEIVKKEMMEEKGLDEKIIVKIEEYVTKTGSKELIDELKKDADLMKQPLAVQGLNDMELLLKYSDLFKITDYLVFDLSLTRGLDYYTGVVYEAVLTDGNIDVGSVAAGGRYDNLVGMFEPKNKTPCVGLSMGIEPIFIAKSSMAKKNT